MGMSFVGKKCWTNSRAVAPNPDPSKYKIENSEQIGPFLIVQAVYDGVLNYEGRKLMVFHGFDLLRLMDHKGYKLDPHFSTDVGSPIARFPPTLGGWNMARGLIKTILGEK